MWSACGCGPRGEGEDSDEGGFMFDDKIIADEEYIKDIPELASKGEQDCVIF